MGVGVTMKQGKITVTTAQASAGVNVDCGFVPAYVRVYNQDAVVAENTILERWRGMGTTESLATVTIADDGSTSDQNLVLEASNGLSEFDQADVGQVETALTGSNFAKTEGSTTLTGTGSLFTTEVNVGDRVRVEDEVLEVASITSDTVLITTSAFQTTDATVTVGVTVIVPGAEVSQSGFKGFTIPAGFVDDGDVVWFYALGTQFEEEA